MARVEISHRIEVFVGYLLLDAWIGNTDRHHENWAWIRSVEASGALSDMMPRLCASFDHGSSLGALITDREREEHLHTRAGFIPLSGESFQPIVPMSVAA